MYQALEEDSKINMELAPQNIADRIKSILEHDKRKILQNTIENAGKMLQDDIT